MTSSPPTAARREQDHAPLTVKKLLAAMVIASCLGAQVYAAARPSGARWWPFMDYPMYSRSYPPGRTVASYQLRALGCGAEPEARTIGARQLGYRDDHFRGELSAIARDRPNARRHRARLSRLAGTRIAPRPCALQLWGRRVALTRAGVGAAALRDLRWTLLREWRVDHPDSVRVLPGR
jgi:hypothetical protein